MFIIAWLKRLVRPRSPRADVRPQELILNILLAVSLFGFSLLNLIRIIDVATNPHDRGLPLLYTLLIWLFFLILLTLSKRGYLKTASWLFLLIYSLPMFYSFLLWGADLPAALLLAVLIITLSGILIGADLVLIMTALISFFLIVLTYLQSHGFINVQNYWRAETHELPDAIVYAVLMMIIATIAWLFARQISRAWQRARQSEEVLRQERDQLEIRVIERTEQLRHSENEKIHQLYHLAEFGRLASGLFHDLMNPLTAVALNLEQANRRNQPDQNGNSLVDTKTSLDQALKATHKMAGLIGGIKKQVGLTGTPRVFDLNEELRQIIQILGYKARQAAVPVILTAPGKIELYGDPIKFWQIISNLLSNAIEASTVSIAESQPTNSKSVAPIVIQLSQQENFAIISISDQGAGIATENLEEIFKPFFSTKKETGLGLGLSSAKDATEKHFSGTITVTSQIGQGSCFTVTLPINLPAGSETNLPAEFPSNAAMESRI